MGNEEGAPPGEGQQDILTPTEDVLSFELATNPLLDSLVELLQVRPDDFDQIIQVLIEREAQTRQIIKPGRAIGFLAEMYTREILSRFEESNSNVEFDPIPDGTETENYLFKKIGGNLVVRDKERIRKKEHEIDIAEIDALITAGDLQAALEVKTGVYKSKQVGVISAVKPKFINKILSPLAERFNTNRFGYLVAGLSEVQGMQEAKERFTQLGGILVALPVSLAEITAHGEVLARKNQDFRNLRRK